MRRVKMTDIKLLREYLAELVLDLDGGGIVVTDRDELEKNLAEIFQWEEDANDLKYIVKGENKNETE
jgi:hypothetical protein